MTTYITASIGFALCFYGLSPLSGCKPFEGYVSERGFSAILIGLLLLAMVAAVKVVQ